MKPMLKRMMAAVFALTEARTSRRALSVSVSVVVAAMMMASMASPPAWAVPLAKAADWRMNERSGKMLDSSRHHNKGTPRHVVRTGRIYVFNGRTSRVVVPDHASLDPAGKDITLRASVKVKGRSLDDDSYDVVRKGYVTTAGGDYKMEIKRTSGPTVGKLHCLFKGRGGTVSRVAGPDIVDGRWHTLTCIKRRNYVEARVDGRSYTQRGSAGSISNSSRVMVGAKMTNPLDDVFDGRMNFVRIYIAR
jgi:Concanavalin A-like lectin/glucanases superfamily